MKYIVNCMLGLVFASALSVLAIGTAVAQDPTVVDAKHYKLLGDFEPHFPHGPPSLLACTRLTVRGDVTFGAGVEGRGEVTVDAALDGATVADGTVLGG